MTPVSSANTENARRPLKTRNRQWARALGAHLARLGLAPNLVSVLSVVESAAASLSFICTGISDGPVRILTLLLAAGFIQLRLLTNMLDGLIAVESGKHTPTGALFNEIPDRIDDLLILGGAGFAAATSWNIALGVTCAVLALFTAYIRLLAGSLDLPQRFLGPMAKPHRMAALTLICLAAIVEVAFTSTASWAFTAGLSVIAAGTLITTIRRIRFAARDLRAR